MFKNKNIVLFGSALMGSGYAICFFISLIYTLATDSHSALQLALLLVGNSLIPLTLVVIGVLFNWVAFNKNDDLSALICTVLYTAAAIMVLDYFMFFAPVIILGVCGYFICKIDNAGKTIVA